MSKPADGPRKALGRGLSALLPSRTQTAVPAPAPAPAETGHPVYIAVDQIEPNPVQPRTTFEPEKLQELAASIQANGIIQPVVVQKTGGRYQLIAGERRWRAAQLAGLTEVPAVVREHAGDRLLEISLIENIQREDLNALEVASAFERLSKEHGLSHEEIGQRTGKDRSTVTNMIRLLKLPQDVQVLVAEQRLTMGHARAILGLDTEELQKQAAWEAVDRKLSVHQVEALIKRMSEAPAPPKTVREAIEDPNVRAAVQELEAALGTKVRIVEKGANRGKIEIEYYSTDDLDRIYHLITRHP